jgi:SagB-type dehydrogenase family enzyme
VSSLYVAITGLLMDLFGSPQFFWHSYAGYVASALAGLHITLNWRRITAYLRRRFGRSGRTVSKPAGRETALGRRGFLISFLTGAAGFVLGWLLPGRQAVAVPDQPTDLGQFYHQWSKPGYGLSGLLTWGSRPPPYKTYPEARQISLPDPGGYQALAVETAINQRRSRRAYRAEPLSLAHLSGLLHAASGITAPRREYRAAPSAGALYPIETYVIVGDVTGLEPGLYHYRVADHRLEQLRLEEMRTELVVAGIGQQMLGQAPVTFVLTAIFQRTRWKYRDRSYRYIMLEAGHIGQNLYLAATAMGLGACAVGAFLDDNLNTLLGVDGEAEAALYLIPVGKV